MTISPAHSGPIIELDALTVRYGERTALDGVSVSVEGGAVGLLGPNGAGKSTLIKTLLGLLPVASGRAKVLGQDVGEHAARLRRRIGYMPERDAGFPGLTGFQATWYAGRLNGMPDGDARRRAHEVLLFAGLEEARYRDTATYSTGMRQRVKLAQALVHDPDLLFLDEPTNGLDPRGRLEMLDLIRLLAREKGIHVMLSSHLLRDVEEVCNAVVVMQGGKIVRHERLSTLSRSTPDACSVRIGGDPAAFRAACEARGLVVISEKERELELRLPREGATAAVFAAAVESGAIVRMLRPVRVSLEDALIDVLGEQPLMVIHDRSYARWNGSRDNPVSAVSVILQAGLRRGIATLFRRKLPAVLLVLAAYGPFIFFLGVIYVRYYVLNNASSFGEIARDMGGSEVAVLTTANGESVYSYMFVWQWPFVLIACVLLGSGLVAEDRRANALELYLSRPVTVRQYLLGKLATMGTFIAMVTLIPTLILILAALSISWNEPGEAWRLTNLLGRTLLAGALWIAIPSMLIVTASSLTSRARNAAILWLAVVVMLEFVISNILQDIFHNDSWYLLQIGFNVRQLMTWILGDTTDFNARVPLWQSVVVLLGWCALCIPTMLRRVQPVEVVA